MSGVSASVKSEEQSESSVVGASGSKSTAAHTNVLRLQQLWLRRGTKQQVVHASSPNAHAASTFFSHSALKILKQSLFLKSTNKPQLKQNTVLKHVACI